MNVEAPELPFAHTSAARELKAAIETKKTEGISLRSIGRQLGYRQPVVLSHMASGRVPIPLERAHDLATIFALDERNFTLQVLAQRYPATPWQALFAMDRMPSRAGADLIWRIEAATGKPIQDLTADQLALILEVALAADPVRRWLTPFELPTVDMLRDLRSDFSRNGLSPSDIEFLREHLRLLL